jgi:hypothetical protein
MAQRLATEYIKAHIQLARNELDQFISMFKKHQPDLVVTGQGSDEIHIVFNDNGESHTLSFRKHGTKYVCLDSYRINNYELANFMRKVMSTFKGDAIVNRIYSNFVMVYYYNHGSVVRIKEIKDRSERLVYEYKNTALELQSLFDQQAIEETIGSIQEQINHLLDQRIGTPDVGEQKHIDEKLKSLSHQLFVLEA